MKRIFKILVAMLAIVGATSAEAQTKEFLEAFNQVKHLVGYVKISEDYPTFGI